MGLKVLGLLKEEKTLPNYRKVLIMYENGGDAFYLYCLFPFSLCLYFPKFIETNGRDMTTTNVKHSFLDSYFHLAISF